MVATQIDRLGVSWGPRVRRSWLLIPADRPDLIERSWTYESDVIVLDLEDLVHDARKHGARANLADGIAQARRGGAEVFVRCDLELLYADLEAAVWRGLQGIILPKVTTVAQIHEAEELLSRFEAERGVMQAGLIGEVHEMDEPRTTANTTEIHLSFEDARGNDAALELIQSSRRVRSVSLGRADLVMDLRPEPSGELHLMPFLMQRLILVAHVARVAPIGAWWQGNSRGLLATAQDTLTSALLGRANGFKGALCVAPEQVIPLNRGFTPSEAEVVAAEAVVAAFESARADGKPTVEVEGVLAGSAAARGAEQLLAWAEACVERNRFKAAAVERARAEQGQS